MDYLKRADDLFLGDRYAVKLTGIKIEAVDELYAKCRLDIEDKHFNNIGTVMGGAIFTLADYAFGVAANTPVSDCVSLSSSINFTRATTGPVLYAEARCEKNGRTVCFFTVDITDGEGRLIAQAQFNGFRSNTRHSEYTQD